MKTIIITSNEDWSEIWYSKQHYANELSKLGYEVYFLNAPKKWSPFNIFKLGLRRLKVKDNFEVLSYWNQFPLKLFPRLFLRLNDTLNCWKLRSLTKKNNDIIWWHFDPFRFVYLPYFNGIKRIYHVTDDFFEHETDQLLAKEADLVVATSYPHYENYLKKFPSKTIHIPHGIADEQIGEAIPATDDQILLVGTMNDDYDYDLLELITEMLPNATLKIVGPESLKDKQNQAKFQNLISRSNVDYIGAVHSNELVSHIRQANVCISAYKFNMTRVLSSLKILNYLGQQKPVVTTINYGFESLQNKGVFLATDPSDFIQIIEAILQRKSLLDTDAVKEYLNNRKYPVLINKILNSLYD